MVPAAYVVLDALPLNANQKLDRRSLPTPAMAPSSGRRPETPDEVGSVAGLFGEILGREDVGADEDFFGLGGSSLGVAKLIARVRTALGRELAFHAVFETPTVGELVHSARTRCRTGPPSVPPARPGGRAGSGFVLRSSASGSSTRWKGRARPTTSRSPWALSGPLDRSGAGGRPDRHRRASPSPPDGHRRRGAASRTRWSSRSPMPPRSCRWSTAPRRDVPARLAELADYCFDLGGEPPLRASASCGRPERHLALAEWSTTSRPTKRQEG